MTRKTGGDIKKDASSILFPGLFQPFRIFLKLNSPPVFSSRVPFECLRWRLLRWRLGMGHMFIRAYHRFNLLPRSLHISCFPPLDTGFFSSRDCYVSHVFLRLAQVTWIPTLSMSCIIFFLTVWSDTNFSNRSDTIYILVYRLIYIDIGPKLVHCVMRVCYYWTDAITLVWFYCSRSGLLIVVISERLHFLTSFVLPFSSMFVNLLSQ